MMLTSLRPIRIAMPWLSAVLVLVLLPAPATGQTQDKERRFWLQSGAGVDTKIDEFALHFAAGGVGEKAGFEVGSHVFAVESVSVTDVYFNVLYRSAPDSGGFEAYPMAGVGFVRATAGALSATTFELNLGLQASHWWESGVGIGGRVQWFKATTEGSEGRIVIIGTVAYSF